ncbi:hypothetical protein R50072_02910 [Simiduia litorea]|uniref:response regulator receiver protein n=1 Tax=Simiduia litorea TaxID=1435348 RepID=UPI0036F3D76D
MTKRMLSAFCFLFLVSSQVYAATWHSSTIKKIYPLGSGSVVLLFETDSPACTNGSTPKYYYINVGANSMTAEGRDALLSVALTAAATGKQVSINFDETSDSCDINRLSVDFGS